METRSMEQFEAWYEIVRGGGLRQGDLISDCPVVEIPADIRPPSEGETFEIETITKVYDVIILTQSCDMVNGKIQHVLVCPIFPLADLSAMLGREFTPKELKSLHEQIRKGYQPNFHMLDTRVDGDGEPQIQLLDFRAVFSVPFGVLHRRAEAEFHLRLKSPYREHLSQAFARFFMRVGLPADIPPFK
jgi:hypothetical protein